METLCIQSHAIIWTETERWVLLIFGNSNNRTSSWFHEFCGFHCTWWMVVVIYAAPISRPEICAYNGPNWETKPLNIISGWDRWICHSNSFDLLKWTAGWYTQIPRWMSNEHWVQCTQWSVIKPSLLNFFSGTKTSFVFFEFELMKPAG